MPYDAYGTLINSSKSTPNNYLYAGEQFDSDLGLYYLRARYYKPDTGKFWTADTFNGNNADPLSLHKYLYTADNPVNSIDPRGHDIQMDLPFTMIDLLSATAVSADLDVMEAAEGEADMLAADASIEGMEENMADAAEQLELDLGPTDDGFQAVVNAGQEIQENTTLLDGPMDDGEIGGTRPDSIVRDSNNKITEITEVKNVKYQHLSRQLQIQTNIAKDTGAQYRMIFSESKFTARTLSEPLKKRLIQIGAKVFTTSDGKILTPVPLSP